MTAEELMEGWISELISKLKYMGVYDKVEKRKLFSDEELQRVKIDEGEEAFKEMSEQTGVRYIVYTRTDEYDICGYDDLSYMGCIVRSRSPLIGMRDLTDGSLDKATWDGIEEDIIEDVIESGN